MALHSTFCPYCKNSFYLSDQAEGEVHCGHCSRLIHVQNHGSVKIIDNQYTGEHNQNVISTHATRTTLTQRRRDTDKIHPPIIHVPDTPHQTLSKTATALKQYVTPVFTGVLMFSFATVVLQVAGKSLPPDRQPEIEAFVELPEQPPVPVPLTSFITSSTTGLAAERDAMTKAAKSVGTIHGDDVCGTVFVIRPGLAVTNYHVIHCEKISDLLINFPNSTAYEGQDYPATLVTIDAPNDLALLRFENEDIKPLPFNSDYKHQVAQPITVIGSPGLGIGDGRRIENFVTDGRLGPEMEFLGHPQWALSMAAYGGNSGGPVIDKQTHEVVAVLSSGVRDESKSFATPHRFLKQLLRDTEEADKQQRVLSNTNHRIMYCLGHLRHQQEHQQKIIKAFVDALEFSTTSGQKYSREQISNFFHKARQFFLEKSEDEFAFLQTTLNAEIQKLKATNNCDLEASITADKAYQSLLANTIFLRQPWNMNDSYQNIAELQNQTKQTASFIKRLKEHADAFGGIFTTSSARK